MASFTAVRAGLAARLATISGLNPYAVAKGQINEPAAVVEPGSPPIVYNETASRGVDTINLVIVLLVSRNIDELAQAKLDAYLAGSGASSIIAAVDGDPTLGGVADWVNISQVSSYGEVEWGGYKYFGARIPVEVNVDGS